MNTTCTRRRRPAIIITVALGLLLALGISPTANAAPRAGTYEGTSTQTHASDILQDKQEVRRLVFKIDPAGRLSGLTGEYWWLCVAGGYHGSGYADFSGTPIPATKITVGRPFEIKWESLSTKYTFAGTVHADGTASGTIEADIGVCGSSLLTWRTKVTAGQSPAPSPSPSPSDPGGKYQRTAPYTLAGNHTINGRQWKTTCEAYSQTERCRTEIMATTVAIEKGRFVRKNDWTFNNLTYLPFMTRAAWGTNPLANHNMKGFSSGGRQWRTECDTERTGRGGCRSYMLSTVYTATPKASGGYTFSQSNQWVFNNMVLFG